MEVFPASVVSWSALLPPPMNGTTCSVRAGAYADTSSRLCGRAKATSGAGGRRFMPCHGHDGLGWIPSPARSASQTQL